MSVKKNTFEGERIIRKKFKLPFPFPSYIIRDLFEYTKQKNEPLPPITQYVCKVHLVRESFLSRQVENMSMSRSLLLCFVFDGALVFQMDSAVGWQGSLSWEIQSERKSSTEVRIEWREMTGVTGVQRMVEDNRPENFTPFSVIKLCI